ncbi:adaptor protein MecA [Sporosarcina sp. HYO08]|uniref:adaptor protein MecA n=1 Tax=Sporosarcina sp. HYO08 TaxID=1759557 RepID=UPI0007922199|nr:adaptor protein MecA [Sporosarcina sp. HYO08]KXH79784.1 adaptor protein MecA [Sporosarcina sp. HYO08]
MEIERINENTVKFFLSYMDIEERGFTREEVWYNRDKSEELFWEMMDEINDETEFEIEGPLWIQVHAMSGGIEVTVTRAQLPADGEAMESPFDLDDPKKFFQQVGESSDDLLNDQSFEWDENMFVFEEFENLIQLANRVAESEVQTSLYSFEDKFYLQVIYDTDKMDDAQKTDIFSVISEFGTTSNMTIHRLEEYGTIVMESDVFETIKQYF